MGIGGRKRAEVFNPSIAILADSGVRFNMRVRPVTTKQTVFTIYVIRMYQQRQELCVESFLAQMLLRRLCGRLNMVSDVSPKIIFERLKWKPMRQLLAHCKIIEV